MEGVIQRGTGIAIKEVGKTLAGKTGTTNDAKDLWFVGFSPNLAFGVFMGYDKPRSLGGSAQAALYTAPIFRDFMKMALKDTPDTPFRVPPGIKLISVDVHTRHARDRAGDDPRGLQAGHRAARHLWRGGGGGRRRRRVRRGGRGRRPVGRLRDRRPLLTCFPVVRPAASVRVCARRPERLEAGIPPCRRRSLAGREANFWSENHAR